MRIDKLDGVHTMFQHCGLHQVVTQICLHYWEVCRLHTSPRKHWQFITKSNRNPLSPSPNPRGNCAKNSSNVYLHNHQPINYQEEFQLHNASLGGEFDGKFVMMVVTINLNTDKFVEVATDVLIVQIASIATDMGAAAVEFQLSNQHIHGIAQSLVTTLPSLLAHNHFTIHMLMLNGGILPQHQAPLGFHNSPSTNNNHQGYNIYHE